MSTAKLVPNNLLRDCSLAGQSLRGLFDTSLTVDMYQQDYNLVED
jgi:hypothetical protein